MPSNAPVVSPAMGKKAVEDWNAQRRQILDEYGKVLWLAARDLFEGKFDAGTELTVAAIEKEPTLSPAEKHLLVNLVKYMEDLRESRFTVGVLGRFKSGKSTILNALAERDCSPVNTRVTTGVLTLTARAAKARTWVKYLDGHEEDIANADVPQFVDNRWNPDNEKGVESVSVLSPELDLPEEMVYVDTPGLHAANDVHERITIDFVRHCSAAVLVSGYPPFGSEELKFYEKIRDNVAHVFLVQNLPTDKMVDWVVLECQTIGSLFRVGLLTKGAPPESQRKELDAALRKIADAKDQSALVRIKEQLGLKLFSVDAKLAEEAIAGLVKKGGSNGDLEKRLQASRFPVFKQALYRYLGTDRGRVMLDAFRKKAEVLLDELTTLCRKRKGLLEKGLAEIEREIQDNEKKRTQAADRKDAVVNRAKVEATEGYRRLRSKATDDIGKRVAETLIQRFGDVNEYRLSKDQKSDVKNTLDGMNNDIALESRAFADAVAKQVAEAQDRTRDAVGSTCLFERIGAEHRWPPITVKDLIAATSLEAKAGWILTFLFGLITGSTVKWVAGFATDATFTWFLMGFAVGVGLRFVLYKKVRGLIGMLANFMAKFKGQQLKDVLQARLAEQLRTRLDGIEQATVQPLVVRLEQEVSRAFDEYFDFVGKTLSSLKAKKETGKERYELAKYEKVLTELTTVRVRFKNVLPVEEKEAGEGLWGKLKGIFG